MKRFFLLFILLNFGAASQAANDIAAPSSGAPNLDEFFSLPPSAGAQNDVEKELQCIQFQTKDKKEHIAQAKATKMIHLLAGPLDESFKRFKVGTFERAMFYAQTIEESGGFTMLSESAQIASNGPDPLAHVIHATANDAYFQPGAKVKSEKFKANASSQYGEFRGRGLLQISRCDNFLSVIHYLNQLYAGKIPEWKSDWKLTDSAGNTQPLSVKCSKEQLKEFASEYRRTYGMNANLYGALDDPMHFAMIGSELKDPVTLKKISSERFMVDSSLAYWRGRCGKSVRDASDVKRITEDGPCAKFASTKNEEPLAIAVKCITQCVHGTTDGWERRLAFMNSALRCAR